MKPDNLNDLNKYRRNEYYKCPENEAYLKRINVILRNEEIKDYKDIPVRYPYLFVFGLPRSGTTLMAQILIQSLDLSYINNFMARFWMAPLTGIKLSRIILGNIKQTDLTSSYGSTNNIYDLHEFGYFWRYWLNIRSIQKIIRIKEREEQIDWAGLRTVLANMQQEFGKAVCMKNIFGAYHLPKMIENVPESIWIYIERSPLDVAISILNARKKFYTNVNYWWSTIPLEYDQLKSEHYIDQIAGQIYYLDQFYKRQLNSVKPENIFKVDYRQLCQDPTFYINALRNKLKERFGYLPEIKSIPTKLTYRTYEIDTEEKHSLKNALKKYKLL